ncbi:MAG: penicillin acylase family protein [Nitrososphaerales archaeon]
MKTCRLVRVLSVVSLLALLVTTAAWPATPAAAAPPVASVAADITDLSALGVPATITRDSFGVPHIASPTTYGLFYGWGYAVAQDRGFQLDLYRRSAEGRLAEVLGPGLLKQDQLERRESYTPAEYQQMFDALPPDAQQLITAYGDGINAYMLGVAGNLSLAPAEFLLLGYMPEPWTTLDSMALIRFMVRRFGEIGGSELTNLADYLALLERNGGDAEAAAAMYNDLHWVNDPTSPVTVPPTPGRPQGRPATVAPRAQPQGVAPLADEARRDREERIKTWERLSVPPKFGSYAWAISPQRTAGDHPLLYGGPQMGFGYPDIIHEVELNGGDGDAWHVTGMGFAGAPLVLIGENASLAWTSTTGMGDNMDVFVETLNPANPAQYWHNGAWHDMELRVEPIAVRTNAPAPGVPPQTTVVPYPVYRTVHGPVVAVDPANGVAYSQQRQHWLKEQNTFLAFAYFDTAHNLAEFGQGAALVETSHNFMVATNSGDIAYWQTGHVPMRADGSWVGRFPWNGDGSEEWQDAIRPLPYAENPQQGYLANWNNKAETDFDNGDDVNFGTQFRVQQIFELLHSQASMTRQDMNEVAKSIATISSLGIESRYVLGPMLSAALKGGRGQFRDVVPLLRTWDGHQAADAIESTTALPAAVIFDRWLKDTLHNTFDDEFGADVVDRRVNVNHLIHVLNGARSGVPPARDYFRNEQNPAAPQTADGVIAASLAQTLAELTVQFGTRDITQWTPPRGTISFSHPLFGKIGPDIPLSNRSTYAMIAEPGADNTPWTVIPSGQSAFFGAALAPGQPPAFVPGPHTLDQRDLFRVWKYKQEPGVQP